MKNTDYNETNRKEDKMDVDRRKIILDTVLPEMAAQGIEDTPQNRSQEKMLFHVTLSSMIFGEEMKILLSSR